MASQYTIPIHLCQWCYKKGGVYIMDCLCVVCKKCYANKGEWFTQPEKCFCCYKKTNRKFIDMKESPQEGSFYYQNISNQIKNLGKVQQFQQEINRKYCKHLSKKVQKYEQTINRFVQQFPEHFTFFQNAYYEIQEKQAPSMRSKSLQSDVKQDDHAKHFYPSHSEKSLSTNNQLQQKFVQRRLKKGSKKDSNFQHEYTANPYQSQVASKKSNYSDFDSFNHRLMNQNINPQRKMLYQSVKNSQASSRQSLRQDPSHSMLNQNMQKKNMQVANNTQFYQNSLQGPFPVYKIGGNKKLSDPSKQINLNNLNMQTALRSIKSDDEKCPPPFHQNNNGESRRKFAQRNIVTNQMQQYEDNYNPPYRRDYNQAQQKRFPK